MDTSTGELKAFDTHKELEEAQAKNSNLQEITREFYIQMQDINPEARLAAYAKIAGQNKSKQRRAKKLRQKMASNSRRRNRR